MRTLLLSALLFSTTTLQGADLTQRNVKNDPLTGESLEMYTPASRYFIPTRHGEGEDNGTGSGQGSGGGGSGSGGGGSGSGGGGSGSGGGSSGGGGIGIGSPGATGATGATGAQGEMGLPGLRGAQGSKGDKGDVGPAGAKGDQGIPGQKGPTGAPGVKGDKGDVGPAGKGEPGPKGDAGPAGAKGDIGPAGAKGSTGSTGASGAKGDKGDKGERGEKGEPGVGAGSNTASQAFGSLYNIGYQSVSANEFVTWDNAGIHYNTVPTNAGLTFKQSGVYLVNLSLVISNPGSELDVFQLYLNGVPTGISYARNDLLDPIPFYVTIEQLLNVQAGDVLSVHNDSSSSLILPDNGPSINAKLTAIWIAPSGNGPKSLKP